MAGKKPTIKILGWDRFQHYKDRSPPWIKLHRSLLDNRQWHALSGDASKLLAECWLLASESEDGTIELSTTDLAWRLRRPKCSIASSLQELVEQEFIDLRYHDASDVLATCLQGAIPERETERETETEGELNAFDLDPAAEEKEREPSPDPKTETPPPEEAKDALAGLLLSKIEERDHPRSTSIPKDEDDQHALAVRFFTPYFPPTRPGASFPTCVRQWMGAIPREKVAAAIRELERSVYPDGNGGEHRWGEIEEDVQKRMIVSRFNELLARSH